MERMMKVQDVLLKAMAKKISWLAAAEIIGVTPRTMRRWRERLEEHGYSGLADRRKGKASFRRVPLKTAEQVLKLYQEKYYDLNVRHFREKLRDEHGIDLSYTWIYQALLGAGLVQKRRKRAPHRRRRERRPLPGMLLHIDGSKHQWFNDDRWYDLIVILDDATSEIYYAQLVEEESTRTVMAGLREVIDSRGLFCALYSDRGSHFFVTVKEGERVDKHRLTQVGRAMKELGVQMIAAYSPQARGRSERSFGTWQGRLPQELRLAGIATSEEANRFLRSGTSKSSTGSSAWQRRRRGRRFGGPAGPTSTGFSRCRRTCGGQRQHGRDRESTLANRKSPVPEYPGGEHSNDPEHLDGTVSIRYGPHVVGRYTKEEKSWAAANGTAPWKRWERGSRGKPKAGFRRASPLPWKSRGQREIPTFPRRRLRLVACQRQKPNPRRRPNGRALSGKADRSCVNPLSRSLDICCATGMGFWQ